MTEDQLRYRVPNGQDPAVVIAELTKDGFDSTTETIGGFHQVAISCPPGSGGREAAREAITRANRTSNFDGGPIERPVVFEGEPDDHRETDPLRNAPQDGH